jgi:hypothetical protein
VCTETYERRFEGKAEARTGLGSNAEGSLITLELYRAESKNRKFIPVVFSDKDVEYVPIELSGAQYYNLNTETGYENLYRHLTNQPSRVASPVAMKQRSMPQMKRKQSFLSSEAGASGSSTGETETFSSNSTGTGFARDIAPKESRRKHLYVAVTTACVLFVLIGSILVLRDPHLTTMFRAGRKANDLPQLTTIVGDITRGVGSVAAVHESGSARIILFEETEHTSLKGQIEIAVMLNRLYERYGFRNLGQEGVFTDESPLNASWYHPSLQAEAALSQRDKVAVQLLSEGEISSAEMMTLVYPDFRVVGVERPVEYSALPPQGNPELTFLLAIAEATATTDQSRQVEDLLRQKKNSQALDLLMRSNPFTSENIDSLGKGATSVQEIVSRIERIQAEAARVHARISDQDRKDLEQEKVFFQRVDARSDTMSQNMVSLVQKDPETIFALVIGAAHVDRVSRALERARLSFAVVRPELFSGDITEGASREEWFDRKLRGLSVDKKDMLGAFLDGRKKAAPVLQRVWLRSKAEAYVITALIAGMADSDEPVLTPQAYAELNAMQYITLVPSTLQLLGKDKIFELRAQVDNRRGPADVWVKTTKVREEATLTLETALTNALANLASPPAEQTKRTDHPVLVTSDVLAVFSARAATVESAHSTR